MGSNYEIPKWAGKPPAGLHLDVLKEDQLVRKLMVDEKKCYFFGRDNQLADFCVDHASCSRVHAAFVYHKLLNIAYLVDLESTHGTFIGALQLEPKKPTKLNIGSVFRFGASTRHYVLRSAHSLNRDNDIMEELDGDSEKSSELLNTLELPACETELNRLTEYNTAKNRNVSTIGIPLDQPRSSKTQRKQKTVTFNDEVIILNPEDVDATVGRFRNLLVTSFIPAKRARCSDAVNSGESLQVELQERTALKVCSSGGTTNVLALPNPAPDVAPLMAQDDVSTAQLPLCRAKRKFDDAEQQQVPKTKQYAKEAWPGR